MKLSLLVVALLVEASAALQLCGGRCAMPARCTSLRTPATVSLRMPWEPEEVKSTSDDAPDAKPKEVKKGIDFSGLAQLVTMGAGAPMLGDLKKVNFGKSEAEGGAALQFELEANNFEDEKGNIKSGAYRDEGWVDEDAPDPMAFLGKLFGGGK